jgi:hypothetical protein
MRKWLAGFILISALQAVEDPLTPEQPWLTGTLLSPFGYVIEKGHANFEPYFYGNTFSGAYGKHQRQKHKRNYYTLSAQPFFWYGFAHRCDIEIAPQLSWNHVDGASHWVLNDMPVELEFQILYEKAYQWWPAMKLALLFTVPFGKYQKLDPKAQGTDMGGEGSWEPGAQIVFQRLFNWTKPHAVITHFTLGYTYPTPVHVKDINAFGGGKGTRGKAFPGPCFLTIFGLECTLTQNWALALDAQYLHTNHTHFSGKTMRRVGAPSSEQFSLAPAIEYNWSANFGLISGVWFSIAGRNTQAFANAILAINLYL